MSEFYTFPDIETLDRHPEIFGMASVVVTEKIHGTNSRFGLVDGEFKVGARNTELTEPGDGFGFYGWMQEQGIEQRLRDHYEGTDIIVYGEWYGPKVQKGVVYATEKQFRGFAVRIGRSFVGPDEAHEMIQKLGLETVPVLYRGVPTTAMFDILKGQPSQVALENALNGQELGVDHSTNTAEGIVIYPAYPLMDRYGEWLIAKYKSEKFAERVHVPKEVRELSGPAKVFVFEFVTAERFEHVLQHLREDGTDVTAPKAIGAILKALAEDVLREGAPEFAALSPDDQKAAGKRISDVGKTLLANTKVLEAA